MKDQEAARLPRRSGRTSLDGNPKIQTHRAWAMILLLAIWMVFFVVGILPDGLSPGFARLPGDGIHASVRPLDKTFAVVTPGRVEVGIGPFPGGGSPASPRRYGSTKSHAVGVELADGRWIDVLSPYETHDEAWGAATGASRVFGGGSPLPVAIAALLMGVWMALARHP